MKAEKKDSSVELESLRNQVRDLKDMLKAANSRAAYWAGEVGRLRSEQMVSSQKPIFKHMPCQRCQTERDRSAGQ